MIRHVLFDLDGTLLNTWRLYMEAYRLTFEQFYGRAFHQTETLALLALRPRSETWLLQQVLGRREAHDEVDAFALFLDHYRRLHDTHFSGVYTGVPEMLQTLRTARYRLGIVTGKSRQAWAITETKVALVPFDIVITETEVRQPKPDPQGILTAAAALRGTPDDTVYVGDSVLDGEAARAAGYPFWAAAWAKAPSEMDEFTQSARTQGARHILRTPNDLIVALGCDPDQAREAPPEPRPKERSCL